MADKNPNEEMITIPKKEYDALQADSLKLSALEGAGVDNWQGYDDAMDILDAMKKEENDSE